MQPRLHPTLLFGAIALQVLGLVIWWEWFNAFAFGTGSVGWGIFKVAGLAAFLSLWTGGIGRLMENKFQCDPYQVRAQDILAGLPLALLPLLILLEPLVSRLTQPYALKLLGFVWLPWWRDSVVLAPSAKGMLLAGGLLIMLALGAKIALLLNRVRQARAETQTPRNLFVLGMLAYLLLLSWPACMTPPQSGECSQLLVMQALAFDASFNADGVLGRGDYLHWHPHPRIGFQGHTDSIGRLFLPVAPGMPLLFLTFYLLQGRWLMSVLSMLFAAGAAAQLFGLCRDRGFSPRASLWVWLIALVNFPLSLYGYQQYEVAAGAFLLLWGLREAYAAAADPVKINQASAYAVGLAAGLMLLGGLRALVPAGVLLGVLAVLLNRAKRSWQLTGVLGVAAIPGFFAAWFYLKIYRFFLSQPVYDFNLPWEPGAWLNLLALFSDRFVGLVWSAPIWVLGVAGLWWLLGTRHRLLAWAAIITLVHAVLFSMVFPDPRAEGSSFHRVLATVIPLAGLGLAAIIDYLGPEARWRRKLLILGAWGAAVACLQWVWPFLSLESARIKLGESCKLWGWLYSVLPSFQDPVGVGDIVLGVLLLGGGAYLVYRARTDLNRQAKDNLEPSP